MPKSLCPVPHLISLVVLRSRVAATRLPPRRSTRVQAPAKSDHFRLSLAIIVSMRFFFSGCRIHCSRIFTMGRWGTRVRRSSSGRVFLPIDVGISRHITFSLPLWQRSWSGACGDSPSKHGSPGIHLRNNPRQLPPKSADLWSSFKLADVMIPAQHDLLFDITAHQTYQSNSHHSVPTRRVQSQSSQGARAREHHVRLMRGS